MNLFRLVLFANLDLAFNVPDRDRDVEFISPRLHRDPFCARVGVDKKCHLANRDGVYKLSLASCQDSWSHNKVHVHTFIPPLPSPPEVSLPETATSHKTLHRSPVSWQSLAISPACHAVTNCWVMIYCRRMLQWLRFARILRLVTINCDDTILSTRTNDSTTKSGNYFSNKHFNIQINSRSCSREFFQHWKL